MSDDIGGIGGGAGFSGIGESRGLGSVGESGGLLGGGDRSEVSRAAANIGDGALGREATRITGAENGGDGFERAAGADRVADAQGAAERPLTEPSRIATVNAPQMTVNTDGAGAREGRHFQPQTAFQVGGRYLDAQNQSFMALRPQELPAGARMGDPVEVTVKGGKVWDPATGRERTLPDQTIYGILGDKKGRNHAFGVEGSSLMHRNLGSTASPHSGTVRGDVQVRVAVGAGEGLVGRYGSGPGRIPTEAEIQDYARRTFQGR